ncbi:unnamed protein product [Leptidea sinapis]|uniref:Lipase domain-containing protein n=1 Tax=Leptidea sinapis TaxID=189913 RepID=A0A5E4QET8_9NEOP|nr:unnamed protein product [Leptidea sinapis]
MHVPIKVLVHGWNSKGSSRMNPQIRDALLHVGDFNVIVVDWRRAAMGTYTTSVWSVPGIGQHLGWFLQFLFNNFGGNWNNLHLIGFSLGAHVIGNAGRTIGGRAGRLTGLDPAGPQWGRNSNAINRNDGVYVENIHTDGGLLGIFDPVGDVDFYPNGGRNRQPGCMLSTCSHSRGYELFAASVRYNHFNGRQCANLNDARNSPVPTNPIISKVEPGLRYQYAQDSDGNNHLVDLWMSINDLSETARFFPEVSNVYHLFTRSNPTRSQPLLLNNVNMLQESNFDGSRRTIVLIHVLLAAENVNVIVVDWSSGANSLNYRIVNWNSVTSGEAVAKFINFVNQWTGSNLNQYHIIGHGVGGHKADRLSPSDSLYTEVIHTNYLTGYVEELGHVDFYPNGGISMPGCDSNECDHARSFFYFAESVTSGGFTGRECLNYYAAVLRIEHKVINSI